MDQRDDFAATYERIEEGEPPPATIIGTDEEAEKHGRSLSYWRAEEKAIQDHYEAELWTLNNWRQQRLFSILDRQAWHTAVLTRYAEVCLHRTRKLVYVTLKLVQGRERVEILDPEKFCKRHEGTELVRIKTEPNKEAVGPWMKEHAGILPDGADIVRQPDTWKIE